MRILAIADDDSLIGHLEPAKIDVLLSLGDLWDATIAKAQSLYQPTVTFAVKGNHDGAGLFQDSVSPLHLRVETLGDMVFGGFNGSWRYNPRGHHLFDQHEVVAMLREFPRVDVFVAHNSPAGIHERDDDVHRGFEAFRDYIDRMQPAYFIHGHQHVNQVTRRGETTVVGVFGEALLDLALRAPGA
jgi:Icc-related predicted phosphoesterase